MRVWPAPSTAHPLILLLLTSALPFIACLPPEARYRPRPPPSGCGGPHFHRVRMALSEDCLDFDIVPDFLVDHSSVPDAVLAGNEVFLYSVEAVERGSEGLAAAIFDPSGGDIEIFEVNVEGSGGRRLVDPDILKEGGGWRLFYLSSGEMQGDPASEKGEHQIRSAKSGDGLNFIEEDGVRFSLQNLTDPDLVRGEYLYRMFLTKRGSIISATSRDGYHFTLDEGVRVEGGGVSSTIILPDGRWRIFFCRGGTIWSAISRDGLSFEEEGPRLEGERGAIRCDPSIIRASDGKYILFFKECDIRRM